MPVIDGMRCGYCREPIPVSRMHWAAKDGLQILKDTASHYRFIRSDALGTMVTVFGVGVGHG